MGMSEPNEASIRQTEQENGKVVLEIHELLYYHGR